jgi:hypothetical protein
MVEWWFLPALTAARPIYRGLILAKPQKQKRKFPALSRLDAAESIGVSSLEMRGIL